MRLVKSGRIVQRFFPTQREVQRLRSWKPLVYHRRHGKPEAGIVRYSPLYRPLPEPPVTKTLRPSVAYRTRGQRRVWVHRYFELRREEAAVAVERYPAGFEPLITHLPRSRRRTFAHRFAHLTRLPDSPVPPGLKPSVTQPLRSKRRTWVHRFEHLVRLPDSPVPPGLRPKVTHPLRSMRRVWVHRFYHLNRPLPEPPVTRGLHPVVVHQPRSRRRLLTSKFFELRMEPLVVLESPPPALVPQTRHRSRRRDARW